MNVTHFLTLTTALLFCLAAVQANEPLKKQQPQMPGGGDVVVSAQGEVVTEKIAALRYARSVMGDFDDVFEDLKFAISERNYRVTGVNSIGKAITERQQQPFALSSVVHFCNIEAAKKILAISRDYLLLMPCRITLQQLSGREVLIEARLLPIDDARLLDMAVTVNNMLREIVDFAAGDW